MRSTKLWILPVLALAVLAFAGCTGNSLDDGGSADVVLEVSVENNPSVTANTQGGSGGGTGVCVYQVTEWTVTFNNVPKNMVAVDGSPYNDIVVDGVDIAYTWDNPANALPDRFFGTMNVVVPVGESATVSFYPLAGSALQTLSSANGESAAVALTFRAHTVEGTAINQTAYSDLVIDSCPVTP